MIRAKKDDTTEAKKTLIPTGRIKAVMTEPKGKVKFTAEDKALLEKKERLISSNIGAFLILGEALSLIKERDLHKLTDPDLTFEKYCSNKWGFGKAYAYRLINSHKCVKHLQKTMSPNGVTLFPTNEAQVRPMEGLTPDTQVKVWTAALKKANGGIVTAALVEEVMAKMEGKPAKSYRHPKARAVENAEHKKLKTIAKLVEKALKVNSSDRTIKKLSAVLETIRKLLTGNKS